jgi:hypothetical protein
MTKVGRAKNIIFSVMPPPPLQFFSEDYVVSCWMGTRIETVVTWSSPPIFIRTREGYVHSHFKPPWRRAWTQG